jgi:hypothetical protein
VSDVQASLTGFLTFAWKNHGLSGVPLTHATRMDYGQAVVVYVRKKLKWSLFVIHVFSLGSNAAISYAAIDGTSMQCLVALNCRWESGKSLFVSINTARAVFAMNDDSVAQYTQKEWFC